MGCRCQERGQHILAATRALVRGDTTTARGHLGKAANTVRADARDLKKFTAARLRLMRGR